MATSQQRSRVAVYPGTFDPITNGHVDLATRAAPLFDRLIVAIAEARARARASGSPSASRSRASRSPGVPNIEVRGFATLLADLVEEVGAGVILRGLRAVSDFEYEFQLASMNRHLIPTAETLFLTPSEQYSFISSSLVREIARLGGDVSGFVHPVVQQALRNNYRKLDHHHLKGSKTMRKIHRHHLHRVRRDIRARRMQPAAAEPRLRQAASRSRRSRRCRPIRPTRRHGSSTSSAS